jgi:hypothetical protein
MYNTCVIHGVCRGVSGVGCALFFFGGVLSVREGQGFIKDRVVYGFIMYKDLVRSPKLSSDRNA